MALGIDIGTGSTKAGLVSADGRLVAVARAPHAITEPRPGWSETDPRDWWVSATSAVTEVLAGNPGVEVAAIGMSGQMHGVVLCDRDGRPLRPAVLWSDRRSEPLLDSLRGRLDRAFEGTAGARLANPVVTGMAGPSVAALVDGEPGLADEVAMALQPKDWLRLKLTGEVATDPSDASATLLWDVVDNRWSAEACQVFGVDQGWLPPVEPSGGAGGVLTRTAGGSLGLPVGIPVAVGAADTAAALLGAGVGIGETQVSTGTGGQIARLLDRLSVDPSGRTHLFRTVSLVGENTGSWYAMAAMQNVGVAVNWATALFDLTDEEINSVMAGAVHEPANDLRFAPYLTGERTPHMDPTLTGAWTGLRPSTTRADLVRSVFGGVATAMADGKTALEDAGHRIDAALLAGGGSIAPWWRQLLADALNLPLIPHDAADASVRGAALLGWFGVGHRVDPATAVHRADPILPAGLV